MSKTKCRLAGVPGHHRYVIDSELHCRRPCLLGQRRVLLDKNRVSHIPLATGKYREEIPSVSRAQTEDPHWRRRSMPR